MGSDATPLEGLRHSDPIRLEIISGTCLLWRVPDRGLVRCSEGNCFNSRVTAHHDIFRLDDRVALVVGGSGGIGSALAKALAEAGASISIAGRSAERAEAAAAKVRETGAQSLAVVANANNLIDCERMVAETLDRF